MMQHVAGVLRCAVLRFVVLCVPVVASRIAVCCTLCSANAACSLLLPTRSSSQLCHPLSCFRHIPDQLPVRAGASVCHVPRLALHSGLPVCHQPVSGWAAGNDHGLVWQLCTVHALQSVGTVGTLGPLCQGAGATTGGAMWRRRPAISGRHSIRASLASHRWTRGRCRTVLLVLRHNVTTSVAALQPLQVEGRAARGWHHPAQCLGLIGGLLLWKRLP